MSTQKVIMIKDIFFIIKQIMDTENATTDKQVADILNVKPNALSNHKLRGSIPYEALITFCDKKKISIDWLLTGEGEMTRNEAEKGENSLSILYKEGGDEEDPELARLLNGAKKVLTSGNKQAFDALSRNIDYFSHAIEMERRLSKNESDISLIKDSLLKENAELKRRLDEMDREKKLSSRPDQPEKVSVNE